jgi:hypothetical protein
MEKYICQTCGVQYAETLTPPEKCIICQDERQYVAESGQSWTTFAALQQTHRNLWQAEEENLWGIGVEPKFAIGQRALLIHSSIGNILWDCVPLCDDQTIARIKELGGLTAIAISHPHFYSAIAEWSHAFGGIPIYLHAHDRQWVTNPTPEIVFWEGDNLELSPEVTLINCAGHFSGSSVLHWSRAANGNGALLTGDTIYAVADRRYVSFMHSFPNLIPLPAHKVQRIVEQVAPYAFDRLYSAWFGAVVKEGAKAAVELSAKRYITAISE